MEILHTEIKLGIGKPLRIIHASDTHLTFADERDGERKVRLAEQRKNHFLHAESAAQKIKQLHLETGAPVIYTGDLIDFVSEANLEAAKDFAESTDCFMTAGNHEFSLYVGEAKEDAAYRNQSLCRVQASFGNDIRFSSRLYNGVNFVGVDNSYYLFEKRQLDRLKEEVGKGFPVVLCMHNPVYSEELYEYLLDREGRDRPAYLMSVPKEKMKHYSPERYEQQKEDKITHEAYEYILSEKGIKSLLVGHVHCPFEFPLGDKMQYGVGCTDVRIVDFC